MAEVGQNLCKIRDVYRAIMNFEADFQRKFNLCLNEGMMLCSLQNNKLSPKEISQLLGLTTSNTSKIINSLEVKMLIKRTLGKTDKRQMYISLTEKGNQKIDEVNCDRQNFSPILNNIVDIVAES
ncbi:MAG: winged helix DNA-binding protein [Paludibacter sp.]|nr:winged helix DNA-binding protein [Paludibacter sp.]